MTHHVPGAPGLKLRPYQERAIERVFELFFVEGVRRVLLVLPTGGGKTVIASEIVRRVLEMRMRVLMLAHRRELIKQAFTRMARHGLEPSSLGIIMAAVSFRAVDDIAPPPAGLDDDKLWQLWARRRPRAETQIGSIDTFRNCVAPDADFVIFDEAHRALAKSYQDTQAKYPEAFHLGLTATPFRADGKGLSDAYDAIVVVATFMDLVEEGFLIEPICYGSSLKVDLSTVRKSKGDYNAEDLAKAANKGELVGDIVDHYLRLGNNAPCFCFAVDVAHSKHLAERFNAAGVPARHVDGNTETTERDDAIRALKAGEVKVLCNCNVFAEGTDVPCVKTIILARPTLSEGLYLQQAGRGARPDGSGLPFVILDHAGCCSDKKLGGLPQEPREYSLEGRAKKRDSDRLPPTKDCPKCLAIVGRATKVCPAPGCGFVFPEEPEAEQVVIEEKPAELVPLKPHQVQRLERWNAFVEEWRAENARRDREDLPLAPGGQALSKEWRRRERTWPPAGSKLPKLTPDEEARSLARREAQKRKTRPQPTVRGLEEWFS